MGEGYRARDTKRARDVAIKVVPWEFTGDVEEEQRLARFERETRLLTALNHPHIASVYSLEFDNGLLFLTMALVEGETLAHRLSIKALSVSEALAIAAQIADALEAAHRKGIIHGDLKPVNIVLTPDGRVTVFDFGLARALPSFDEAQVRSLHDARAPFTVVWEAARALAARRATAYTSPEQASGWCANNRSDAWSFGCVLYEMLTGYAAFGSAGDVSDTPAVLTREPDWSALPSAVPPQIATLVRGLLERDSERRISDFTVVRFVIAGRPLHLAVWRRIETLYRWVLRRNVG
jgi:serine/threonine protein kinase